MSTYRDFTSLPPEQEQSFVIFEETRVKAEKKAWTIGLVVAGIVAIFFLGIALGTEGAENPHAVAADEEAAADAEEESKRVGAEKKKEAASADSASDAKEDEAKEAEAEEDKADGEADDEADDDAKEKAQEAEE